MAMADPRNAKRPMRSRTQDETFVCCVSSFYSAFDWGVIARGGVEKNAFADASNIAAEQHHSRLRPP